MSDLRPVIIGVGEASERIDAPDHEALSPADLAGRAAAAALADAQAPGLAAHIEVIASIRQFEVSWEGAVAPFGRSDNFSRAVAGRIGADPARAILEPVGGPGPQHLINEFAGEIAAGRVGMALFCGSEAISTVRHLTARGESRDWSEATGGALEDRGYGDVLLEPELRRHGVRTPINAYALFENARRGRLGQSREAYRRTMAELFAPFTPVAAHNPHAMSREVYSARDLATVTAANRLTSDPFPRRMVARDQANQGAAVLMTSAGQARALGVPEHLWVYPHGGADARERLPMQRQDLSASPAAVLAAKKALAMAGAAIEGIDVFDFYSCFPIAVFNPIDGLGIAPTDPRPLTVTGGLPFFGGAGNNYSMHAIASMVRALRARPGARGLISANGGFLSKTSVGVYSTTPADWPGLDNAALQAEIDGWPAPPIAPGVGTGVVETYTIDYGGPAPTGSVIGRLAGGERFVAMAPAAGQVVEAMIAREPLGARLSLSLDEKGRSIIGEIA